MCYKERDDEACRSNQELEQNPRRQEHISETLAHQRRPNTLHEPATAVPRRVLFMHLTGPPHTRRTAQLTQHREGTRHRHGTTRRPRPWGRMRSGLAGGLLFAARAVFLACVGGLACLMRMHLRWFPALVPDCLCMPNHHVCPRAPPRSSHGRRSPMLPWRSLRHNFAPSTAPSGGPPSGVANTARPCRSRGSPWGGR